MQKTFLKKSFKKAIQNNEVIQKQNEAIQNTKLAVEERRNEAIH